jgi:hypothetical protein
MIVNETLQAEFTDFVSSVQAKRLKINIMRILLSFLKHERITGLPNYADEAFADLVILFDFLSAIDREAGQPPSSIKTT